MTDDESPNWKFDDRFETLNEINNRIEKTVLAWKNDLKRFRVTITRLNKK